MLSIVELNVTHSIARLCEDTDRGNWCATDSLYTTCYSTCRSHYCNHDNPSDRKKAWPSVKNTLLTKKEQKQYEQELMANARRNRQQWNRTQNGGDREHYNEYSGHVQQNNENSVNSHHRRNERFIAFEITHERVNSAGCIAVNSIVTLLTVATTAYTYVKFNT